MNIALTASTSSLTRVWREATGFSDGERMLAEETAIAITFNRVTHAVMMATPADLRDFAIGFSLSEEIVPEPAAIQEIAIVEAEGGIELRLWIPQEMMQALERRRRRLAGATGCGMCGLESLAEALRPIPAAPLAAAPPAAAPLAAVVSAAALRRACAALRPAQALNAATRAVHGAGFWTGAEGLVAVREDVGRHNALDKLTGALAAAGIPAASGIVLLTSRISIELVQKAARLGAPIVAAVSAPTALAVRAAEESGMTLVGVARDDGFEVFTHPWRVE